MDRPERTQAAGGPSHRQITPGTTPEPGQAAFRGRQVAEVPAAGPSPSRTKPQSTQATAAVSGSPVGPALREAGRAGRRFQPYFAGEPGRPGATHLPVGGPSVPPVPQGGRQKPERLVGFVWRDAYFTMQAQHSAATKRGDTYAAAASDAALREIERAVEEAHSTHLGRSARRVPDGSLDALKLLKKSQSNAKCRNNLPRAKAILNSLDCIERLTQAKSTQLEDRHAEFQSASPSRAVPVPQQEALGEWLQAKADAAPGTEIEHSYFTQLLQELSQGHDPWTVSRELMDSLPTPGDAQQRGRLQAAHKCLVRAIACGLSDKPSESGGLKPWRSFPWRLHYDAIKDSFSMDGSGSDFYAATARTSALQEIDSAVMDAYFKHRLGSRLFPPSDATEAMEKIRTMRRVAARTDNNPRIESIQLSLEEIYRLTSARCTELERRDQELQSASLSPAILVPDREALGRWLRDQADAAPGTGIERTYFTRLAQELADDRDPWTVSRKLMGSLPGKGNEEQSQRLRDAHGRLLHAMAGIPPQPAAVAAPITTQTSGENRAPVSTQQDIVGRLNSRMPLSHSQVQAIMSAVGRANMAGELGLSTSQPEAWANDLVFRVQTSLGARVVALTESERDLVSSDLKRLGELVEQLGRLGYL